MRIPASRFARLVFALSLVIVWNFQSGRAVAQDPADVYLSGYMMVREAEEYYEAGDPASLQKAYSKLHEAGKFFATIAQRWQSFEPGMVEYRRKKINELISKIERDPNFKGAVKGYGSRPLRAEAQPGGGVGIGRSSGLLEQKDRKILALESAAVDLRRKLEQMDRERTQAIAGRDIANQKSASLMKQIALMQEELTAAHNDGSAGAAEMKDEIARLQNELELANKGAAESEQKAQTLKEELDKASNYGLSLAEEKKELARERERVRKLLSSSENEQLRSLVAENDRLRNDLQEAREEAGKLRAESGDNKEVIAKLRAKITTVENELIELKKQNVTYREQVAELTDQLKRTDAQLDAMAQSKGGANPLLVKENRVLRDIIGKQLKSQSRRNQAKQRVVAELAKLELGSQEVLELIDRMGDDAPLSADEIQIFQTSSGYDKALIFAESNGGKPPEYPEVSNNDGPPSSIGLNQDLTQFAKAAAYDFFRGNFERCESSYERILQIAPDNIHSLRNLGIVKIRLKKWDEAKEILEKALAYGPADHYSHYVLGVLHYRQKRSDAAIRAMEESLRLNPRNARAHFYIAVICMEQTQLGRGRRNPDRAVDELKKVLQLDPKYGDAHFNLAILYIEAPEPQILLARQHYRQALLNGSQATPEMERRLGS